MTPAAPLTATESRYQDADHWNVVQTARILDDRGRRVRIAIGYVGPEGTCRRTYQGPLLSGPYAYAYPLPTVIDNYGGSGREAAEREAAGLELTLDSGDTIEIRGQRFEYRDGTGSRSGASYGNFIPLP
jgi:hypothetical protein